ncbi:MAG: prepilin peptidase [Candidatus Nomurabacteria bacterium]|nr:prepilin peptidase [Candidatus Nomurabacteria bacterium]
MILTITILFFLFGAIIGSFLNVVIYRFNTGKTFGGRSMCMACSKSLSWYELVPVFSFLIQKGKCRNCKAKISIQYPLVEVLTGFVFAAIFLKYQLLFWLNTVDFTITLAYYATLFSLLIVIAVYDVRHKIIPDILAFVFGLISFIGIFFFLNGNFYPHLPALLEYLSGLILALPFAFFWLVSRGRWMGLGDAKLSLGLGWMLGLSLGLSGLVLAFWLGAILGIGLLIFSKKHNIKSEIPFAPFLIIGTFLTFIFEMNFFPFY